MRYKAEVINQKQTIFKIIDVKPVDDWDDELATVYQLKGSKIKRVDLITQSLNLMDELKKQLGNNPDKKTK